MVLWGVLDFAMSEDHTDDKIDEAEENLDGFTFVFDEVTSRQKWENHVRQHGGSVESSVSSTTDYLVAPDELEQTDLSGAQEHEVPVIDTSSFRLLLSEKGAGPE